MNAISANNDIIEAYIRATPGSAELARRGGELLPSGVNHDGWAMDPYPLYVNRAAGALKWDVDGNSYVDYFGGHGALLLGHNHPEVVAAIRAQLDQGTHYGACHALALRWAELVCKMIPSAERVRFTSSGTEATMLALRIARAATGRSKLVRFKGHFHGWNDHMTNGHTNHFDGTPTTGVLPGIADQVLLAEPDDVDGLLSLFEAHSDIAAVILEPTGASFGRIPMASSFLKLLRELTASHGTILIFDEVVTGFRVSPGGAQLALDIIPDLTTLAKILAGGLPGGAVAGRQDLLNLLDFEVMRRARDEKIQHPGTFNGNPLSAAAGIAALELIKSTDACEYANGYADLLRKRLNEVLKEERLAWSVYGTYSAFHIYTNPYGDRIDPFQFDAAANAAKVLEAGRGEMVRYVRLGMLTNGIDVNALLSGNISAAHGEEELKRTVAGFRGAIRDLRRNNVLAA